MARKKRSVQQPELPVSEPKTKKVYRDSFQENVGRKLEDAGKRFEGKGRNILYGIAALAVLVTLIGIYYAWNRRNDAAAQAALGKAIETSQAVVSESPLPPPSTEKSFRTEKERAEAAISDFQVVVDKFGGGYEEKAKYFIAVNKLTLDRPTAIAELEALANNSGEVGTLSKFALAQAKADEGKLDEAAALYQDLASLNSPILAKDTINFELAKIYQKLGKTQEAVDLYFNIAKAASEIKDLEGKPVPETESARESKERLKQLSPEKAKELPSQLSEGTTVTTVPPGGEGGVITVPVGN